MIQGDNYIGQSTLVVINLSFSREKFNLIFYSKKIKFNGEERLATSRKLINMLNFQFVYAMNNPAT